MTDRQHPKPFVGSQVECRVGRLEPEPSCWCHVCRPVTLGDMRMVLCPDCGNKRCPKAAWHKLDCTGSNATGQAGSAYP